MDRRDSGLGEPDAVGEVAGVSAALDALECLEWLPLLREGRKARSAKSRNRLPLRPLGSMDSSQAKCLSRSWQGAGASGGVGGIRGQRMKRALRNTRLVYKRSNVEEEASRKRVAQGQKRVSSRSGSLQGARWARDDDEQNWHSTAQQIEQGQRRRVDERKDGTPRCSRRRG